MAAVRVPMEGRTARWPAGIRGTAPAASRLADVVRGALGLPSGAVVPELLPAPAGGLAPGSGAGPGQSLPARAAALPARDGLRLSLHRSRHAPRHRSVVAEGARRALLPGADPPEWRAGSGGRRATLRTRWL